MVFQTVISRGLCIPMPILLLPPTIMGVLGRLRLVPSNPRLKLGVEVGGVPRPSAFQSPDGMCSSCADLRLPLSLLVPQLAVIMASLSVAMPVCLAIFPPTAEFKAEELEPQFRGLRDSKGREISVFYANKGL